MARVERTLSLTNSAPGALSTPPDRTTTLAGGSAGYPPGSFQYAGVCFTGATMDEVAKEIRLPRPDITDILYNRFNRRELDAIARTCERSIIAKDSPVAFVEGVRRPFASFLLEQVSRVLAGGPREV